MPRKVRVLTTSFSAANGHTVDSNRELACAYVEAASREQADLICLPEDFLTTGVQGDQRPYSEPIPGPTFNALSSLARKSQVWVVAGYCVLTEAGRIENSAVVIDRQGNLAGRYAKVHPTIGECEDYGITPGSEATVIETDFGRIGLAICYDIGWPEHWADLQRKEAELVIWPSAYDGGFPLQVYAWSHLYYVVSSVRSEHSKVIDPTGCVLASTSRWHHVAAATIDLEKEVFHIDQQVDKLFRIQQELGERVSANALSQENVFTLESNDPEWPITRIKEYYGLENLRDYLERATQVQKQFRTETPQTHHPVAAGT